MIMSLQQCMASERCYNFSSYCTCRTSTNNVQRYWTGGVERWPEYIPRLVLLGFSQAYVFTTFFKVWIQCYKYKYNHCKRNWSAIISYIVSVDHVRSGVRIISWITISASDIEFGRTRWEKVRQLKKESSYVISQRLLYRPSVSKWER